MEPIICSKYDHITLFNFSFTLGHSPYGPTYLRAIEGKLDVRSIDGLFILAVDPWALSAKKDGNQFSFTEADNALGKQCLFIGTPNYEYLVRNLPYGWGSLIGGPLHDIDTTSILHADGWLEMRIDTCEEICHRRAEAKLEYYRTKVMPNRAPCEDRIGYLRKTVELLKEHGMVILVRIPVGQGIQLLEDSIWPSFNEDVRNMSGEMDVQYMDYSGWTDDFQYTDGNHLTPNSAIRFSRELAEVISVEESKVR